MPRKPWGGTIPAERESYESKRRAALETAARAFNERGFYKTSLNDIAAELHVTKAALYYYFESKDEILYECHAVAIRSLTDTPLEGVDDRRLSGLEKIERLLRRYAAMIVQSFGRDKVRPLTLREGPDLRQVQRDRPPPPPVLAQDPPVATEPDRLRLASSMEANTFPIERDPDHSDWTVRTRR